MENYVQKSIIKKFINKKIKISSSEKQFSNFYVLLMKNILFTIFTLFRIIIARILISKDFSEKDIILIRDFSLYSFKKK